MEMNEKDMIDSLTIDRPLVTFALFTYNQERFIAEAIKGALLQTYSPLEIIISDDCSSDNTWEVIQREVANYAGPHRLVLNRNEINLGIGAHVNHVMKLSHGELVVAAAGDDVSVHDRTKAIVHSWIENGKKIISFHSGCRKINDQGQDKGIFSNPTMNFLGDVQNIIINNVFALGATSAWHRKVYATFGPFEDDLVCEDQIIPVRAMCLGGVVYIDKILVYYRIGTSNWIASEHQTSSDMTKLMRSISANRSITNKQIIKDILQTGDLNLLNISCGRFLLNEYHKSLSYGSSRSLLQLCAMIILFGRARESVKFYLVGTMPRFYTLIAKLMSSSGRKYANGKTTQ